MFAILCNPLSPHDRGPIISTFWKQKLGQVQAPARACTAAGMTARQCAGLATAPGTMGMSQLITGHPDARRPRCRGFRFALHINPKTPNRRLSISLLRTPHLALCCVDCGPVGASDREGRFSFHSGRGQATPFPADKVTDASLFLLPIGIFFCVLK